MSGLFRLSDEAWAAIEPHLPGNEPGARRVDDRRVMLSETARDAAAKAQCASSASQESRR